MFILTTSLSEATLFVVQKFNQDHANLSCFTVTKHIVSSRSLLLEHLIKRSPQIV